MLQIHRGESNIVLTCAHRLITPRCLSVRFVDGIGVHACVPARRVIVAPPCRCVCYTRTHFHRYAERLRGLLTLGVGGDGHKTSRGAGATGDPLVATTCWSQGLNVKIKNIGWA